jgi:hypothetical protein
LRRFDVTIALDQADRRLLPGTSVALRVAGPRLDEVLVIPRQAIFEREGRTMVYVKAAGGFEARDVKVAHRGESRAAIEGVDDGAEVALIRPDDAPDTPANGTPSSGPVVAR